jgi:hypothetical protein
MPDETSRRFSSELLATMELLKQAEWMTESLRQSIAESRLLRAEIRLLKWIKEGGPDGYNPAA